MSKIINWLFNRPSSAEKYLAQSVDLIELERRQQELHRKGIWL
jgi:hypothetical protein